VGVCSLVKRMATFMIGEEIDWDSFIPKCNNNIEILDNGKLFLVDFCKFQYGILSTNCKPHQSYIRLLQHHGLIDRVVIDEFDIVIRRKRVSMKKKLEIFSRDEFQCQYCSEKLSKDELEIDHFYPVILGGDNSDDNLVTSCKNCNGLKWDKHPTIFITEIQNREYKILDRVYKLLDTLQEKEKELELEKEEEDSNPFDTVRAAIKKV